MHPQQLAIVLPQKETTFHTLYDQLKKKEKNTQSLVFPAQALPPSPFHSNMAAKLATVTCVNLVVGPVLKCPQPLETQRYTLRQLRGSSFFFTFQCHHQTEDRDDLLKPGWATLNFGPKSFNLVFFGGKSFIHITEQSFEVVAASRFGVILSEGLSFSETISALSTSTISVCRLKV